MTSGQLHIQPHNAMEVANSNQELLSKGRKRRTTLVIVGSVILVALLIGAVLYFLHPESTPMRASYVSDLRPVSLEAYLKGEFSPRRFNGTWVSESEILYRSSEGVMLYNARTKRSRLLLSQDNEFLKQSFEYDLSADHRYLMLAHSYQKLYRYTFLARYHIIDLETKKGWPITDANGNPIPLQLVKWAPTDNSYVYVYMNDIYLRRSAKEQSEEFRLTNTGRPGTIYNGVPDWVYEEEILSSNTALWFSPDGRHLAFATFNDSRTPVMNIPYYGSPGDIKFQYTQAVNIRYPKPGRPNPTVTLSVIDLSQIQPTQPIVQLDLPPKDSLREPVLGQVKWASSEQLIAVWMNRVQNELDIINCFMHNRRCQQIMSYKERHGWISLPEIIVSPDSTHLGLILPREQEGNLGNYRHLVKVNISNPSNPKPLTSGKFTVTELLAWDDTHIYFLSTPEGKPSELALNRVRARGGPIECISCEQENPDCLYTGAEFSKKTSAYYMLGCTGPVVPEVHLFTKEGRKVTTWERNERLRRKLEDVTLPEAEEIVVQIAGGHEAHVQLFKPPGMDTSGNTKYPLLVQVYGGPDSNVVTQRYSVDWYSSLVVNQSVVYAKIDGRGSGLKGDRTLFAIYRNLGTAEVFDQLNITRHLLEKLPYLDKERTAIWGWSYGGYATAMALAQDKEDIFKCGISVAPVTDWLLYDTLYTERFMGLPTVEDNLAGYENASLNSKVENLRTKKYFLIHGTLDDNVHYQQSMMLAKALEMKDILFEQQSYPDEAHGLSDVRPHLYHSIIHFLKQCFSLQ